MYYFFFDFDDADKDVHQRFVLIDVPIGASLDQVFNDFYDATPDKVAERVGAILLLRPAPKLPLPRERIETICRRKPAGRIGKSSWLNVLVEGTKFPEFTFARFPDHSIHIIGSENFSHFISSNINPSAPSDRLETLEIDRPTLLRRVQYAEIDHLLIEGRCRLPSFGSQYYRAPSQRLVRSFIRVGNIQRSRHALDAIFFWLLPHLTDCIGVITDTWSISSLSQNISRRLTEYRSDGSKPCPVEMLGNYADSAQHVRIAETIGGFVDRLSLPGAGGSVLVLISATQTGSLQKSLNSYLTERGISDRAKYICILKLGSESQLTCLHDMSNEPDFVPITDPTPKEIETAIDIDPTVYFPVQAQDIENVKTLNFVREMETFSAMYGRVPFARVHFTDDKTQPVPRHHMVWIDTSVLIETEIFESRLKEHVVGLHPAPSVLVYPSHPAAALLAKKVSSLLDGKAKLICHEDLGINENIPSDEVARKSITDLSNDQAVLLLDDAFITGFRITTYQMNLRKLNDRCVLHYLSAISRPENRLIWERQKNSFLKARGTAKSYLANTFSAIEYLILPNWSEKQCPWCAEIELGDKLPENLRRYAKLGNKREGLRESLFLVRHGHHQPALQSGSFFGEAGMPSANVFCFISSLIQRMRTERIDSLPLLGEQHFLVSSILSQDVYIKNFTDIILACSFLRASLPGELIYRNMDKERLRTESLNKRFRADGGVMLGELLFSKLTERLPLGVISELESTSPNRYRAFLDWCIRFTTHNWQTLKGGIFRLKRRFLPHK